MRPPLKIIFLLLVCAAVGALAVRSAHFLRHSSANPIKANSVKLPFPAGDFHPSANAFGEIAYFTPVFAHQSSYKYPYDLFVQKLGPGTLTLVSKHTFVLKYNENVAGCEFSPNGKHLLVKILAPGVPDDVDNIAEWNPNTQSLQPGPQGLRYRLLYWSPNGDRFAYVLGGDRIGYESLEMGDQNQDASMTLCVYDLATRTSNSVVQHPVLDSTGWLSSDTLLYATVNDPMFLLFERPVRSQHPNIYSYSVRSGTSTELIADGFSPAASADGQQIAFLGWPARTKSSPASSGFGVYVYDVQKQTRTLVYPIRSSTERNQLAWLPDGKRLLLLRILYRRTDPGVVETGKDYPAYGTGHFILLSPALSEAKELAVVKTTDTNLRDDPTTIFRIRGFSQTGSSLYFATKEVEKGLNVYESDSNSHDRLCALNLNDGAVQEIYSGTNLYGVGWHP